MEADLLVTVAAVMILAGLVQGSVGFGSGLVAVGLLAGPLGIKTAAVITAVPSLAVTLAIILRLWRDIRWRCIWAVILGAVACVPLGVLLLGRADARLLALLLGVLLLGTVCYNLLPARVGRPWHPIYVGLPIGMVSGLMSGSFAAGGPPLVAYASTHRLPHAAYVASLQAIFCLSAATRVVELTRSRLMTLDALLLGLLGAAAIMAGARLGMLLVRSAKERLMRAAVLVLMVVLGGRYVAGYFL